jgi:hypothetical protein
MKDRKIEVWEPRCKRGESKSGHGIHWQWSQTNKASK